MNILSYGFGNMGSAMLLPVAKSFPDAQIDVLKRSLPERDDYPDNISFFTDPSEVTGNSYDTILLSFKPQDLEELAPKIRSLISKNTLVVSMLAGVKLARYSYYLGEDTAIIRIMPNIAAHVRMSETKMVANAHVSNTQRKLAEDFISASGTTSWGESDRDCDRHTSVSGSGIGFALYILERIQNTTELSSKDKVLNALDEALSGGADNIIAQAIDDYRCAAIEFGLSAQEAQNLSAQIFKGAMAYSQSRANDSFLECMYSVVSKKGTTDAGLKQFGENIPAAQDILNAFSAAEERGEELNMTSSMA